MPKIVGAGVSGNVIRQPSVTVDIITRDPENGSTIVNAIPPGNMSYHDIIIEDGPLSYWRLGEASGTVADDELTAADGTYFNSPTLGVGGIPGSDGNTAVSFNPVGSQCVLNMGSVGSYSFIQNAGIFAVECWVKMNTLSGSNLGIIGNTAGGTGVKGFSIYFQPSANNVQFSISKGVAPLVLSIPSMGNSINDTTDFHHIVCTGDGTFGYIYIDGAWQNSDILGTLSTGNSSANVFAGAVPNTSGNPVLYFDGIIDEVAIYNKYLSADRILAHYNAGIAA